MKLLILVVVSTSLVACAKKDGTPADVPSCAHDVSAREIVYSDGVTRKSELTTCTYSSGKVCNYATWVNDSNVTYQECH